MAFAQLPAEIMHNICSHCDASQLMSLKSTCRSFVHIANEWLFYHTETGLSRDRLVALQHIADTDTLSHVVRKLVVHGHLPKFFDYDTWYDALPEYISCVESMENDDRLEQLLVTSLASNFGADADGTISPECQKLISELIAKVQILAKRQSRRFLSTWEEQLYYQDYLALVRHSSQALQHRFCEQLSKFFLNCKRLETVELHLGGNIVDIRQDTGGFVPSSIEFEHGLGRQALQAIIQAGISAEFSPRSFILKSVPVHAMAGLWDSLANLVKTTEEFSWHLAQPVHLDDETFQDLEVIKDHLDRGPLGRCLAAAQKLRSLRYEGTGDVEYNAYGWPSFGPCFGDFVWPRLTSLSVHRVQSHPKDLTGFLLRHAGTLSFIWLEEIGLEDSGKDSWPESFQLLAGRLPKIRAFQLRGQLMSYTMEDDFCFGFFSDRSGHGTQYGKQIEDYIRSGNLPFPRNRRAQADHLVRSLAGVSTTCKSRPHRHCAKGR